MAWIHIYLKKKRNTVIGNVSKFGKSVQDEVETLVITEQYYFSKIPLKIIKATERYVNVFRDVSFNKISFTKKI